MALTVRLFVSSTFADLADERDALQEEAFQQLGGLCERHGARLQVVDLRWGVAEDLARDQRTMEVCLEEIERCQRASPQLNFLVLLGNRYGWRPLPATILAGHSQRMCTRLSLDDVARFERWYKLDENARPEVHRLLPRSPADLERTEPSWSRDEPRLRAALERAAGILPLDERRGYFASATEQEVLRGALGAHASGTVYCYARESAAPPPEALAAGFVEGVGGVPDDSAAAALADLKRRLHSSTRVRMRTAHTGWRRGRPVGSPRPWLSSMVTADLGAEIERQIKREGSIDPAVAEATQHRAAAQERRRDFTGRRETLRRVLDEVLSFAGNPVVVTGPPGSGKSALLAEVAARVARSGASSSAAMAVLVRLIGTTSASTDERALVAGLCREVDRSNGRPETPLPGDLQGLARALQGRLTDGARGPGLVLVLDALDQLGGTARPLAWLPATLPRHVAALMSTSSLEWLAEQQRRFGTIDRVDLPEMTEPEARRLLRRWLNRAGRSLTSSQLDVVMGAFSLRGLPLQLRLAFEQAQRWPSYLNPTPSLSSDPTSLVQERLDTLAADHGHKLVAHTMGYLHAARIGLAEDELIGVLSRDRAVRAEFRRRSPDSPRIEGLPPVVWYRLAGDLRAYLVERAADGGPVLGFYHRLVEAAAARQDAGRRRASHRALAEYFAELGAAGFYPGRPRPLVELPYQQARAGMVEELVATVSDIEFLEAKAQIGKNGSSRVAGVDGDRYDGIYQLVRDFDLAVEVVQESDSASRHAERRTATVRGLAAALRAEADTLAQNPRLLRQQLVNRLQWIAPELAATFARAPGPGPRTWLRMLTPPRESSSLVSTLGGHDRLGGCALGDGGRVVVGGGQDRWLTVWDRSSGVVLAELVGHEDRVLAFVLSADGKRVVSAGADATMRVWDSLSGASLAVLPVDVGETTACALGARDTLVLTGHLSGAWCTWRVLEGEPGAVLGSDGAAVRTCALSRDGAVALAGRVDGSVDLVDLATGEIRRARSGHAGAVRACLLSPDGRTAMTGGEDGHIRWHSRGGELLAEHHDHPGGVVALAASPGWGVVASGGFDGVLRLHDTRTGERRGYSAADGLSGINACAVGEDLAIAVHVEGVLTVWEVSTGRRLAVLRGHTGDTTGCALDPAEQIAVSSGLDGTVRVWSLAELVDVPYDGHRTTVTDCAVSPDGSWAATCSSDGTARTWDIATGRSLRKLDDHFVEVMGCAISPDGMQLATTGGDGALHLYGDGGATRLCAVDVGAGATACAFGAAGSWVAAARDDGTVRVWSLPDATELGFLRGHSGQLTRILPAANPEHLLSAGVDGTVRLWDVRAGSCLQQLVGHSGAVNDCAHTVEGAVVSAGKDGRLLVWDAVTGKLRRELADDGPSWLRCAISADGQRIAATRADGEARVWSLGGPPGGEVVARHRAAVRVCALSPDGRLLAVGGDDGLLRLLDLDSGRELARLPLPGRPQAAALHPTRPVVLYGDDGGGVCVARLEQFGNGA